MTYLTERQRQVLLFIEERVRSEGVAPTLREIAEEFGFSSTATAQKHVNLLVAKGYLRRDKHQKRGLALARSPAAAAPSPASVDLPLLGTVAAGSPIESLPEDERILVPPNLLRSGDHYVLRVRGESMIDEGIYDGDLVVVQSRQDVRSGDMVVALVAGEVTLKRLYPEAGGRIRLQPSNPTMEPLLVPGDQVRVQGVVVALLRQY